MKHEKWGQIFSLGQGLKIWVCPQKSEMFGHLEVGFPFAWGV